MVSICVPAAGITRDSLAVKVDKETKKASIYPIDNFKKVVDVNLIAPIYWAMEMIASHAEDRAQAGLKKWHPDEGVRGTVIFIGSISSQGNKGQVSYASTKAGLVGASATLTKEAIFHGIRCGVMHPGFTDTPMVRAMGDEYIEKSLLLAPDNVETLILAGSILFSRNLLKEANDIYLKALKLSPDNVTILSNLGHLSTITNSVDQAFKYLNRAIEIDPEHNFSKNILAGIYKTNNDYAKAKELYLESKEPNWEENVLECLYLEECFDDFKEFLIKNSDKLIESRTASALINHANYCLNEHYEHHFCNDQLSYIKTIKCHKNHDINNLNSDLLNEINNYSYDLKKQIFIKNGVQSLGNLFSLEIDVFKNFQNLILKEYDKYFASFENSSDVFINKYPKKPKLMGWFVKISKNTYQLTR